MQQGMQEDTLRQIKKIADEHIRRRAALFPILHYIQSKHGWISHEYMQEAALASNIFPMDAFSVASFYSFFNIDKKGKYVIRLCENISCEMDAKEEVARHLQKKLGIAFGETSSDDMFTLEYTSCLGMCDQGPAMLVNERIYTRLTPKKINKILKHLKKDRHDVRDEETKVEANIKKKGPVLEGMTDPHAGLKRALSMSPQEVIEEIKNSGLAGRGGAGFPTGLKWQYTRATEAEERYVICNADEGEPGTFKDRTLLMEYADFVFDGMTIAAYAIGSRKGFLYLRGEYAFIKDLLESVLNKRRKEGMLGNDVLGKQGFDFDIEIYVGAGAYVCGEESALIESIEGKRGEPRDRPPFPTTNGLWGCPTVINNVETLITAALILERGADWFKRLGTEKSPGTKILSISGDIKKPGIYEVPFGSKLTDLLKEAGAEDAKAVQMGGPSGECVPRNQFNRTIAFEDLRTGGSVIVFGPDRSMIEACENFLKFFVHESCGQCVPCRKGTVKLLDGVRLIKDGKHSERTEKDLLSLARTIKLASKCALGESVPVALLSIFENFHDEIFGSLPNGGKR